MKTLMGMTMAIGLAATGCTYTSHDEGGGGTRGLGVGEGEDPGGYDGEFETLYDPDGGPRGSGVSSGPVCIALAGQRIQYVPLDGSPAIDGPPLSFDPAYMSSSVGLFDGSLYTCIGTVVRVSLLDGFAETLETPCEAVTAADDGIYVLSLYAGTVDRYADHASLVAGTPAESNPAPYASRIATNGREIIAAWHSTDRLILQAADGSSSEVVLEGYDDWIFGLDRLDDGRFVIAAPNRAGGLRIYAADGSLESELGPPSGLDFGYAEYAGIVCGEGPDFAPRTGDAPPRPSSTPFAENCGDGGYGSSNYTQDGADEVHVVGVYEGQYDGGRGFGDHRQGSVNLRIRETDRPITLVLNSYESTRWDLTLDPGARIERIVTTGYYEQDVVGAPVGTSIDSLGEYLDCVYGWEPENNIGGCSYAGFMSYVHENIGQESSFQGCYSGDTFVVPYN